MKPGGITAGAGGDGRSPVAVVTHVSWETPHRIVSALAGEALLAVEPLAGQALPNPAGLAGAVVMGGPMGADDDRAFPGLAQERCWIAELCEAGVPLLGVCLGSQLLALALGGEIRRAPHVELGWAEVEVTDDRDPVVGPLAPRSTVLHWHSDEYDLPPGSTLLARSAQSGCQAFRAGSAWGVLFHQEADAELVEAWLREPSMAAQACEVLGEDGPELLRRGALRHGAGLAEASEKGFRAFAELVAARRRELH